MTHTSKHRTARAPRRRRRLAVGLGAAALVTGGVVAAGTLQGAAPLETATVSLASQATGEVGDVEGVAALTADELAEREQRVSRSTERAPVADAAKARQLSSGSGRAETQQQDLADADPKTLAQALMPEYGLSSGEFSCLDQLWEKESGWSTTADNPSSSAYGIPQALPGSKMSSAGADWQANPETQIRWGLGYIRDRYGSACGAWGHSQSNNWY
ncbi:lytic transglycosylase domain-containing protein [Nocardioides aequoreus]|uniref:aggregation-promoting factor C-terminal-like domain-containing protein n=1 Tax=Nocardioides aequoreus TaxID=397278 RepID=UPI0004C30D2F|nr:lytic transglycosylase domain-containing protein [Nocardioides aequoreus]